jgi:hypothetical protein
VKFFLILSVDIPRSLKIGDFMPSKKIRRKLQQTEDDSSYEYDYLEGEWSKGKHRKLVGELNKQDFIQLSEDLDLISEDVQTMGMITGEGHYPAISMRSDSPEAITSCYVCPIPDVEPYAKDADQEERIWNRLTRAFHSQFGG